MNTTQQAPKHPKARNYLQKKLFDGIARFVDLEQRIADLPTKQERGDAFEVFVEAYLSTQPLHQAKMVWPFSAIPFAIKDRFALAQREVGVDGVFETHLGDYHAYQAKFRTGRPSLTWDELSTFMGLTDQIAERVVITNCNELSEIVSERRGFYAIRGSDLDRLQGEDFESIRHWLAGAVVEHKHKTPLPRQHDALDAVVRTLNEQDRATIIMPCGTGKTLVALWVTERLGSQKILVLVPSLALVSQTLHEWLKETQWRNPSFLCVCSDPTVTSRAEDTLVLHQADVDFPVTGDTQTVQTFLERKTEGVKVVFCTYQSARVVAEGMGKRQRFDFGIFDEAHKTAGREGAQFAFALRDINLSIAKRLFMTATPRHYRVRKPSKADNTVLVYSMDAEDVYGPVAYRLSFAQAVQDKMICGYKVLLSVVTSQMVNEEVLRTGAVMVEQDLVKARQVANELAVKDAIQRYGIGKVITFHNSVAAAASFAAQGSEGIMAHVSGLSAFHVNGSMSSGKRDSIMRAFAEGERALITNARCLTEGVDVPAVDMVAFLAPKRSRVDIVQATGRAMRKSERTNKTTGYVLLPLFVELSAGETPEEAVARADFEEVWTVLQALQEHDEILAEFIARMKTARNVAGRLDDRTLREKVEILGPILPLDILRQSITTQLLDGLIIVQPSWEFMFQLLTRFKQEHGHCNVESHHDRNLAWWVMRQRLDTSLSEDQKRRLTEIGFVWDIWGFNWETMFQALVQFKQQHGHCNVPWKWPENPQLGSWVEDQRSSRRQDGLSEDKVRRLDEIGFIWDLEWDPMFQALVQFKQQHGHCNVPKKWPDNSHLGWWVKRTREIRRELNKKVHRPIWFHSDLSDYQIRRLDEIGFIWDLEAFDWDPMFQALVQFKQQHGHCNVPFEWPENRELGRWVQRQRERLGVRFEHGLSEEQIRRLNEIGFVWRPGSHASELEWETMFQALQKFKQQHGHCDVPPRWPQNPQLCFWAQSQRLSAKCGGLRADQWSRLEALGFELSRQGTKQRRPKRQTPPT